jgi:sulfate adenylyltransferase
LFFQRHVLEEFVDLRVFQIEKGSQQPSTVDSYKEDRLILNIVVMSGNVITRILDERELCDFECLRDGAFAPLNSYMTKAQYDECLEKMTINSGEDVFPIPICLSLPLDTVVSSDTELVLKTSTGVVLATMRYLSVWETGITTEAESVFGCYDNNHPYIQYMEKKFPTGIAKYVSGSLEYKQVSLHNDFSVWRKTPAELRSKGPWIGFQTRNPLHRSHLELILRAAAAVPGVNILLHPVEGVTQECDVPFPVRFACYMGVLEHIPDGSELGILPLSMRMAGPREAVWHAVIRRNYGCSHFIVGRDHAGPSYRRKDGSSFYKPLEAQELALKLQDKMGIKILASQEVVYCEDDGQYRTVPEAEGHKTASISGTAFRVMLEKGDPVPAWYSYPEVISALQKYYQRPKGLCVYFCGLSGSGKSTLAESLKARFELSIPWREITILDADVIRTHLSKGLGFSKEDRSMNVRRIGYVASEIVRHGGIVFVANIAPYEEDRAWNRKQIEQYGEYLEVFVDTPLDTCEKRDVKGLYAAARAGKLGQFTGISDPFEEPKTALRVPVAPVKDQIDMVQRKIKTVFF